MPGRSVHSKGFSLKTRPVSVLGLHTLNSQHQGLLILLNIYAARPNMILIK